MMDFGALGFGQGIDALVLVKFAGAQLKTHAVTIHGKEMLHAEINEEVRTCACEDCLSSAIVAGSLTSSSCLSWSRQ